MVSKPRFAGQCIGPDNEGNKRMYSAWELEPKKGQTVYIVKKDSLKVVEWKFGWFTQAGARLYDRSNGRHYSCLINWDKGDQLFVTENDADMIVLMTLLYKKSKLTIELEQCEKQFNELLNKIAVAPNGS